MKKTISFLLSMIMMCSSSTACLEAFAVKKDVIRVDENGEIISDTPDLRSGLDGSGDAKILSPVTNEYGTIMYYVDEDGNIYDEDEFAYEGNNDGIVKAVNLPSAYDSRSKGRVTSVRTQGNHGTCWDFACTAAMESAAISQGYADSSIDLAESVVPVQLYTGTLDSSDPNYGEKMILNGNMFNAGGNTEEYEGCIMSGFGTKNESDYPYSKYSNDMGAYTQDDYYSEDGYVISGSVNFSADDIDGIKDWIYNYGAVVLHYYSGEDKKSVYVPDSSLPSNHEVAVVGWDDSISKSNFEGAENDGAWLIKNSWGTYLGDNGYYWISYDNQSIGNVSGLKVMEREDFDNFITYNGTYVPYKLSADNGFLAANVYTLSNSQYIKYVNFEVSSDIDSVGIYIYKLDSAAANPSSGELLWSGSSDSVYNGFNTVAVTGGKAVSGKGLRVKAGTYAVIIKPQKSGGTVSVSIEMGSNSYAQYNIQPNQSYYSFGGNTWYDSSNGIMGKNGNFVINLFTDDDDECSHEYEKIITKEATCTASGSYYTKCKYCGDTTSAVSIPAKGHTVRTTIKEATCTESGYKYDYCTVCGRQLTEKEVIPAAGHNYTVRIISSLTCDCPNYVKRICETCGYTYTEETPAYGHKPVTETKEATCTEDGYTITYCSSCKKELVNTFIPAKGHSWSSEVIAEPSCNTEGIMERTCSVCGTRQMSVIPARGHSYDDTLIINPTCTEQGYTLHSCSVCGEIEISDYTEATGHSYTCSITAATCKSYQINTYTCSVCGYTYTEYGTQYGSHSDKNSDGRCDVCGCATDVRKIISAADFTIPGGNVSYGSKARFTVRASGLESNYHIVVKNGSSEVKGSNTECSVTTGSITSSASYGVYVEVNGQLYNTGRQVTISTDNSFFGRIVSLFRQLFGVSKTVDL